ncbi:MAG TPA: adenylate/guanylate cyclase domain-containing protein, partial [Nitriliruptorales bacterium]
SSIVVNDLTVVRDAIIRPMLAGGIEVDDIADQLAGASAEFVPLIGGLLSLDYQNILLDLLDTDQVVQSSRTGSAEVDLAVGFVDLVGFTRLSAQTDPASIGEVLTAFEDLVHDVVRAHPEVRIAKFIGDAAMFVCGRPEALARALYLIVTDRREGIEQIGRRAGLASGPVITREGDFYGVPVNYAARLTDLARPNSLLAARDTAEALGEDWERTSIGTVKLPGIGPARPLRLRWHGEAGGVSGGRGG